MPLTIDEKKDIMQRIIDDQPSASAQIHHHSLVKKVSLLQQVRLKKDYLKKQIEMYL